MIKCFFVDVKSISSTIPRSTFAESELNQLADLILATDGLIRPLILQESGVEKYTVIDGDREYYAAVIAKEKNINRAEMVNAFVINPKIRQSAIDQLLTINLVTNLTPADQSNAPAHSLLPEIGLLISQQLKPLHLELNKVTAQLTEHKQMLALLTTKLLDREPVVAVKVVESQVTAPQQKVAKSTSKTKASAKRKPELDFLTSVDLTKSGTTLNLINTLSQPDLSLRMQKSGVTSAVKLATKIIVARNQQPEQKFDDWASVVAQVSGLAAKTAQNLIEKLR